MNMGTIKTFVAGLTLVSFSVMPAFAAGPEAGPVKQVGLFAKKAEDCAKDAKKVADKKAGDSKKKAGCDNGCDGDGNDRRCDRDAT